MKSEEVGTSERVRTTLLLLLLFSGVFIVIWLKVLLKLLSGGAVSG